MGTWNGINKKLSVCAVLIPIDGAAIDVNVNELANKNAKFCSHSQKDNEQIISLGK